ncbi:MAG TPA: rhomboid family intramembrane serine protease [Candidatus Limnocylindria bacterium]|jgi:membrane associated rhomboid family serine protease|nr:rhomboid family intramembrane serine protease [Candidatus Limnocylindria bacterium]
MSDPLAVLTEARRLLDTGYPEQAIATVADLTQSHDPEVAGAAWMVAGTAKYRIDDEAGALQAWMAAAQSEGAASWIGWRSVAEQQVRDGDLNAAIEAYKESDRRAPPEERPAIASRLAWLAKETGHDATARREFNRSRAQYATYTPIVSWALIGANVGVFAIDAFLGGLAGLGLMSGGGGPLMDWGYVSADAVAAGEWWRILTSAFLHFGILHLVLNMWALYLFGPLLEQLYGHIEYLVIYLLCAAGGSVLTILVAPEQAAVGASGAIFGLLGLAFAVSRRRHLALPHQTRAVLGQIGSLLVINLAFTFFVPGISITGHLGGLAVGLVLGWLLPPSPAFTLAGQWQAASGAVIEGTSMYLRVVVYLGMAALLAVGTLFVMGNFV